jgi:cytochrome b
MADKAAPGGNPSEAVVILWDLPVRIVHWSFVVCVGLLWWSGETGRLDLHKTAGLTMLSLVLFRILWGILGGATARFSQFVRGPRATAAYIRGTGRPYIGHNPIGGLSVLLLLGLLAAQIYTGLFAQDVDGIESGPLTYRVAYETADLARQWHHLIFNVILAAAALHIAAIIYYLVFRRDNLVGPMITGRKRFPAIISQPLLSSVTRAVVVGILCAALAWWVGQGAPVPGSV